MFFKDHTHLNYLGLSNTGITKESIVHFINAIKGNEYIQFFIGELIPLMPAQEKHTRLCMAPEYAEAAIKRLNNATVERTLLEIDMRYNNIDTNDQETMQLARSLEKYGVFIKLKHTLIKKS